MKVSRGSVKGYTSRGLVELGKLSSLGSQEAITLTGPGDPEPGVLGIVDVDGDGFGELFVRGREAPMRGSRLPSCGSSTTGSCR